MTAEPNHPFSAPPEPRAARRFVPVWLIVLLFALLYWGMVYFDQRSSWANQQVYAPYRSFEELVTYQPSRGHLDDVMLRGKAAFDVNCALCHGPDGMGKPGQAPRMAGSDWVQGNPARLIRIPQNGLTGPIRLMGEIWNQAPQMAPMGAALPDSDLAAVLTYIRNAWGNKGSEITAEQVKAVRDEVANRTQPWTEQELPPLQ